MPVYLYIMYNIIEMNIIIIKKKLPLSQDQNHNRCYLCSSAKWKHQRATTIHSESRKLLTRERKMYGGEKSNGRKGDQRNNHTIHHRLIL